MTDRVNGSLRIQPESAPPLSVLPEGSGAPGGLRPRSKGGGPAAAKGHASIRCVLLDRTASGGNAMLCILVAAAAIAALVASLHIQLK